MILNTMSNFTEQHRQDMAFNMRGIIDQLLDGYEQFEKHKSHWLQKDGIQNCWDARKSVLNKNKKWKCVIELYDEKLKMITITDYGTFGLTGNRFTSEEMNQDLQVSERWCRFENYAFANDDAKDKELLGSRGRGKFIFTGVSKTNTIFYDTLRDDGVYRIGKRMVEKTKIPNWVEDGDSAKQILKENTNDILKPLDHVGTRIIIMQPSHEVIKDFNNGKLAEFISDTWWEIIKKYNAIIILKNKSQITTIKSFADKYYNTIPKSEQKIWSKKNIKIPNWENTKIKNLYILYDPNIIFDDRYQGIAIQRGGMNICRKTTDEFIGPDLSKHITGYVTCERDFEKELRKSEGVEHYSYNWGRVPAKDLRDLLHSEILDFAEKELGLNQKQQASNEHENKAKNRAKSKANQIAKIFGFAKGGIRRSNTSGGPRSKKLAKKLQVQLNDCKFPNKKTERVNYGQSLHDIGARIINNMERQDVNVALRIMIRSIERNDLIFNEPIFVNKDIGVKSSSNTRYYHMKSLLIDKNNFAPGHYKITSDISLMKPFDKFKKAEKMDKSEISFWVEQDPPEGGIWEDFVMVKSFELHFFSFLPKNKQRADHIPSGTRPIHLHFANQSKS